MSDARKEYADIIDLEHHVSKRRQPMPRLARAAQFSPFAALTGYDDLVAESARFTEDRINLTEEEKEALNIVLTWLLSRPAPEEATFTFFVPDKAKAGGSYETITGRIRKHDPIARTITLDSGRIIPVTDLCEITCAAYERHQQGPSS